MPFRLPCCDLELLGMIKTVTHEKRSEEKPSTSKDTRAPSSTSVGGPDSSSASSASSAETRRNVACLDGLFGSLYPETTSENGMAVSRKERLTKGYSGVSLTYGEASVQGFADVLRKVRDEYSRLPKEGGIFYDLGCGTGKPVFIAATLHSWKQCTGFEILADLHVICQKALERWHRGLKHSISVGGTQGGTAEIEFVCGDFTSLDWSDGDVVFANSTCFDDELMGKLAQRAAALKEGAIVITTTDSLPSPAFEVLEETDMVQAGRSATTCYIQRRLPKDTSVPEP